MKTMTWRKRLSILQNRLYLYPAPERLPRTWLFWFATGIITLAVVLSSSYFMLYLIGRHDAFITNAEDFGIMDQAIWSTVHGSLLHQTICNTLFDTNCYSVSGIVRFAIHFEPILFPVSLLYLVWSTPKTLLVVQTLVVASGAYPAFWLARLRLRNELAGIAIALLYLLYPAQQQATAFDFHAVTFTAALLLFTLYFMYTRRTVWLFVFAILSMACKEEIPLVVVMFGLWSMLFQRQWRSGLGLVLLGVAWFGCALLIIRLYSPTGHPLLASRYGDLGNSPVQAVFSLLRHPKAFVAHYVLDRDRLFYVHVLLSPGGYLPSIGLFPPIYLLLFAPWVLLLALPSLTVNVLTSDKQMYTGLFQYNAEIVPVLIFATIEAIVLVLWVAQLIQARLSLLKVGQYEIGSWLERERYSGRVVHSGLLVLLLCFTLFSSVRVDYAFFGHMPFARGFQWPVVTQHITLAQRFIDMIPPDASVSAQSRLVPHISQRENIYLFPYGDKIADYVFLDVTSDIYPYFSTAQYITEAKTVLFKAGYGVVAAQDGYLLLKRGLPAPAVSSASAVQLGKNVDYFLVAPKVSQQFCSFIYTSSQEIKKPFRATFTGSDGEMNLIGDQVDANPRFSLGSGYMTVTTYWQVTKPISSPLQMLFLVKVSDGKEYFASTDVPALFWCQTNTWKPGTVVRLTSRVFGLQGSQIPVGLAHFSVALLPLVQPWSTIMDVKARIPLHAVDGSGRVTPTQGTNALQLMPMTIIP